MMEKPTLNIEIDLNKKEEKLKQFFNSLLWGLEWQLEIVSASIWHRKFFHYKTHFTTKKSIRLLSIILLFRRTKGG